MSRETNGGEHSNRASPDWPGLFLSCPLLFEGILNNENITVDQRQRKDIHF